MKTIESILWILLAHYILDYPLQGDFLAQTKGQYWYSLLAHSMIYGLGMALTFKFLGGFQVWKAVVLVFSHMVIDYKKATATNKDKALTIYLYIDQGLHLLNDMLMFFWDSMILK